MDEIDSNKHIGMKLKWPPIENKKCNLAKRVLGFRVEILL